MTFLFVGWYMTGTGDGSGGVGDKRAKIVGYLVVCGIGVGATLQTSEFFCFARFWPAFFSVWPFLSPNPDAGMGPFSNVSSIGRPSENGWFIARACACLVLGL